MEVMARLDPLPKYKEVYSASNTLQIFLRNTRSCAKDVKIQMNY